MARALFKKVAGRGEWQDELGQGVKTKPFHVVEIMPMIHCRIGDLGIDSDLAVLDPNSEVIAGPYATSEVMEDLDDRWLEVCNCNEHEGEESSNRALDARRCGAPLWV